VGEGEREWGKGVRSELASAPAKDKNGKNMGQVRKNSQERWGNPFEKQKTGTKSSLTHMRRRTSKGEAYGNGRSTDEDGHRWARFHTRKGRPEKKEGSHKIAFDARLNSGPAKGVHTVRKREKKK